MAMEQTRKNDEPVVGVPYNAAFQAPMAQPYNAAHQAPMAQPYNAAHQAPMAQPYNPVYPPPQQQQYYVGENPYQAGMIPSNAIFGDPKGIPIQQTIYRDTPAPFNCVYCGDTGLTAVKSKPSLAAFIGCMMPMCLGVCFLCPQMDCLWHKYHYCPHCNQEVADFVKSDVCMVVDPPNWTQLSYALPA